MKPSRARDADGDDRERLERAALRLAFEANAVAELGDAGSRRVEGVLSAARALERDIDMLAPALDADDRVLAFARLVLHLLPYELGPGKGRDVA